MRNSHKFHGKMFTGIIEAMGTVQSVEQSGSNISFRISSEITEELKVDQSLSHSGVCLTVEEITDSYKVTAVAETLEKTNLGDLKIGDRLNLERCMQMNGRLDGHIVQGHVDCTAVCIEKKDMQGSWIYKFEFPEEFAPLLIEKGSITINGISLTIFNVKSISFTVTIIPFTYQHTNIGSVEPGSRVNIEFDMLGKYVHRILALKNNTYLSNS